MRELKLAVIIPANLPPFSCLEGAQTTIFFEIRRLPTGCSAGKDLSVISRRTVGRMGLEKAYSWVLGTLFFI